MYIWTERFSHFSTTNIGNSMKCQAIVDFIHIIKILLCRIDHQTNEIAVLVKQECHCQISLILYDNQFIYPQYPIHHLQSVSHCILYWQSS